MKTLRLLLTLLGLLAFTAARAGAATLTVTNLNDSGAGSLRQAIADAAASGDTIVFAAGLSGQTIPLTSGEIVLNKSLTIDGSALSGRVTVSGNNASRIFTVSSGQTVALEDLTLTGGNGTGASSIDNGGAIFNQGTLTLTQCTLSGNGVTGYGGAILNSSTLALVQCTLSGNSATYGGAIDNEGTLTLTQCTLSDNGAAYGGAILNYSPLALTHCTLYGNIAGTNGGAIHNASNTVTLTNSVVAGSIASLEDIYNSLNATLTSVGANLVQSFTNAGFLNGGNTISNAAPLVAPLDYYGGPTQTMPPLPGSPAIDGVPAGSEVAGLTTDQRGFPRPAGVWADIGAVEVQSALMVTNNLDNGSIGSLRQAVLGAGNGATIAFAPGLSGGTIILNAAKGEIVLSRSVTIDASGLSGGVTIDGGPGTNRIFFVNGGQTVALKGLTLTGGNASSGGAIFNSAGSLTLTQCTLTNSSVADFGGAIFNLDGGTLALTHCTLSGNSAGYGGALYNRGALTLTQCTLSGNFAPFEGGAIVNWVGTLTLTNSIVAGSLAPSPQDILNGFFGTLTRVGANIVQSLVNNGGTLNGGGTISNAAPLLAPLGNYGGPTQTMLPLPGSPAIDGVPAGSEVAGLTTDQRGFPRQVDGDGNGSIRVDIGAVELRRIIVTTAADELDTPTGAQTSLREAIRDNADAETSADVITFAPGLNGGTITLDAAKGEIVFSRSATIDARDLSGGVTINAGNASRIFYVNTGQTVALKGLTLTGGNGGGANLNGFGGAINNFGTLSLTDCTLSGNSVNPHNFTSGGALYNRGAVTLTGCTLSNNSANSGGGAIYSDGVLTVTQCTLSANSNSGGYGGAIEAGGTATLTQCTLSGNSANSGGGAIASFDLLTLTQCTLSGNSAISGGAIWTLNGTLTLTNNIVARNTALSGADISGPVASGTNNLVGVDPQLAPLGNYGGPTKTMPPLPGSPAIDGVPAGSEVAGLTTDQRGTGFARALDGDGNGSALVDIGAVEVRRVVVTTAADELDTPTGAQISLREAIRDNAPAADVITFAPGLNGATITLDAAKGEIVLSRSATIDASDLSGGVTIDGGPGTNRIFTVGNGKFVALTSLTLTGGNGTGAVASGGGGAILNSGTLTLTQCILSGNSASNSAGAILNLGPLTLIRSTLSGNSAPSAGAIGTAISGPATLTQCVLSGNSATSGGGAFNGAGSLTLTHCTLSGNSAPYGGAFAIPSPAVVLLTHCTLSGNSASGRGGAISNSSALTLTNTIVAGSIASAEDIYNYHVNGIATLTRAGANIVESLSNAGGTVNGSGTISTAAPLLAPLGNYGGPTPTMALLTGSPARNAAAVLVPALTGDQRGFPIIGTPDIGAYEAGTLTNYDAWSYETLPSGANYTFTADQENDGNKNGLEYATRSNPLAANPNPFGEPERVTLQPSNVAAYQFSFPYRPGATDLRYIVYRSPDLATWTEIYRADLTTGTVIELGLVTGDENTTTQIITITDPGFTLPACFWKLTVENP